MDFTNMTKLTVLSIQNCHNITGTIDLTMCPNITEVDATGTAANILIPNNATVLTKYELGNPTEINIVSPVLLSPEGVAVDNYGRLDSLTLSGIPNNKAYNMFDKITNAFIEGGIIKRNVYINDSTYKEDISNTYSLAIVPVTAGHTIRVTHIGKESKIYQFDD